MRVTTFLPFLLVTVLLQIPAMAQYMDISDTIIEQGDSTATVCVHLTPPSGTLGYQFSLVWQESIIKLDSFSLGGELAYDNVTANVGTTFPGELRVVSMNTTSESIKDSEEAAICLFFSLLTTPEDPISISFNPGFPNIFANAEGALETITTPGSIGYSDPSVSTTDYPSSETIILFPNPANNTFQLRGISEIDLHRCNYRIVEPTGRVHQRGSLTEDPIVLRPGTPAGTYYFTLYMADGRRITKPLLVFQK